MSERAAREALQGRLPKLVGLGAYRRPRGPGRPIYSEVQRKARFQTALKMRRQGKTFREIGSALGVGVQRARQIYYFVLRQRRRLGLPEEGEAE